MTGEREKKSPPSNPCIPPADGQSVSQSEYNTNNPIQYHHRRHHHSPQYNSASTPLGHIQSTFFQRQKKEGREEELPEQPFRKLQFNFLFFSQSLDYHCDTIMALLQRYLKAEANPCRTRCGIAQRVHRIPRAAYIDRLSLDGVGGVGWGGRYHATG